MSHRRLIEGLAAANVSFVVVGMVAGQIYGSRIATYDLDIVDESEPQNVDRLFAYLIEVDAFVKETWPNEGFASELSRELLVSERSLTLGTREGELDVLHRIDGIEGFKELLRASRPIALPGGLKARVLTLSALIDCKRASNREKDRLHLLELEALLDMVPPSLPAEDRDDFGRCRDSQDAQHGYREGAPHSTASSWRIHANASRFSDLCRHGGHMLRRERCCVASLGKRLANAALATDTSKRRSRHPQPSQRP